MSAVNGKVIMSWCGDRIPAKEARGTSIEAEDRSVDGFNIGMNTGASAGQTIDRCHIHLIPRRTADVDDPRGGVRHTMPGKGYY